MSLLISKEIEKHLLNKKIKDIKFGCGNITLIFHDDTELYIKARKDSKLEVEVEYFKKERISQILD